MPAEELVRLEDVLLGPGIHFEPAIDGILIQESNFDAYKKNHHHKIPVLAGYNRGEAEGFSRAFGKTIDTVAGLREYAAGFGEKAEEFMRISRVENDADAKALFSCDAMLDLVAGAGCSAACRAARAGKLSV